MTSIEWVSGDDGSAGKSWNPIRARDRLTGKVGWFCVPVHGGCKNCYAAGINVWRGTGHDYQAQLLDKVEFFLDERTLNAPLAWRAPRRIFVCSMTDLYAPWVPDEWLDRIKAVQALTPQHTYIELTKRPARMRLYVNSRAPLSNVWGGCSCSTQPDADEFLPILIDTRLAKRVLSLEPLLGPIDLHLRKWVRLLSGRFHEASTQIHWVIVGGESGDHPRPMHPGWVRELLAQCASADVPFFFKQWGAWVPGSNIDARMTNRAIAHHKAICLEHRGVVSYSFKVGGKGPRLLDGVEHNAFPASAAAPFVPVQQALPLGEPA